LLPRRPCEGGTKPRLQQDAARQQSLLTSHLFLTRARSACP
jgi:hypothetical protein